MIVKYFNLLIARLSPVTFIEFLLGEDIIVAPVLQEGRTSRNIYLPEGKWIDQNDGRTHQGPIWLNDYHAPLDVLPYFVRSNSAMHLMALKGIIFLLFGLVRFL